MAEILVSKAQGGILVPMDDATQEYIAKLKLGDILRVKVTKVNNPAFHRKLFALLNVGFEAWEPEEKMYKGQTIQKNLEQFRNDVVVLAGFYDTTVTLKGEVRLTAKSLSFSSMDHDEREALYNTVINVLLQKVLTNYTRENLDEVVARILRFD
jgi:Protein of unknown function (DUF1367)